MWFIINVNIYINIYIKPSLPWSTYVQSMLKSSLFLIVFVMSQKPTNLYIHAGGF